MKNLKSKAFWADVGVRALRTMAQTAVGVIGSATLLSEVNWGVVASSAAVAGIASVLMSLDRLNVPAYPEAGQSETQ